MAKAATIKSPAKMKVVIRKKTAAPAVKTSKINAVKVVVDSENPSPLPVLDYKVFCFDRDWYLATYPDVALAAVDPADHFRTNGFREGRNPNPFFNGKSYIDANPDLAGFDGNPFEHFIFYGAAEGRPVG